jgi:hypothetical protein
VTGQTVFQLRITLADVEPAVWRQLLVPGDIRLDKLHRTLQAAMGWQDSHLHNFRIGGVMYGMQADDYPDEELDEKSVTAAEALGEERRFVYEYDYGDGWEHEIAVEDERPISVSLKAPVCLNGENACPPEDCGGPYGYSHLLRVLADPHHEEHAHLVAWSGGPIDPTAFDLALVNAKLQSLR